MDDVLIRVFGEFSITVNGVIHSHLISKSRKGVSLLTYLVLQEGKPVSSQRLIREMWSAKSSSNPESALKTMVSRLRAILNELSDGLGNCIQCSQSSYCWKGAPGVQVDLIAFSGALNELRGALTEEERIEKYRRIQELYRGDLIQTGELVNGVIQSSRMHREYLEAMYAYVRLLQGREDYAEIRRVCEQGLRIDASDDFFRIEMVRAACCLNHEKQAEDEYCRVMVGDDGEIRARSISSYHELSEAGVSLQERLEAIRQELQEQNESRGDSGPFFCDYEAFKEFYDIQIRNLRRLGSTMFLSVIMVSGRDGGLSDFSRESAMAGLQEILRRNLRKGDIVTRFSPDMMAMLLPTVSYSTGGMVLERIENLFYDEYPSTKVIMHHRITTLGE